MNLRDLQYLVAVAEHRHFGKAAEASFVSQPALSMQIKKLEEYLGVELFERTGKQVIPTAIGEDLVKRAKRILLEADQLVAAARAARDPFAGDVRLGVFPTLAPYLLPRIMPELSKSFPNVKFFLIEEKSDVILSRLKEGGLDAVFLALPVAEDGLEVRELFTEPFFLAVHDGHEFAGKSFVAQDELKDRSLLLLEEGHCLRRQALDVCALSGASEHQDFRATSLETLRQMVAARVGITLVPELAVRENEQGIRYVPFSSPAPSRTIGMVWRKSSPRSKLFEAIAKAVKKAEGGKSAV